MPSSSHLLASPLRQAVERLAPRVRRLPSGALSLAHLCVIVPTAQSGRRLRAALAARFGALVPPLVKTPIDLLRDGDDPTVANRTDELAAFAAALRDEPGGADLAYDLRLARARPLSDMRTILSARALSFADVADCLRVDQPDEAERWQGLARLEARFSDELVRRGKRDRIAAMKAFRPVFPGIEETIRFDDPAVFLPDSPPSGPLVPRAVVHPCATPEDEARRIAARFASVRPDEALPALCIADPALFPEIETALKAEGFTVHNPAATPLATSSLGHLVTQVVALLRSPSYAVFSAFIRGGDVRRWLAHELKLDDDALTAALAELDARQADYLPEHIDDIAPKTSGTLRAIFEFVKIQLRKKSLSALLSAIFRDFTLDERESGSREFAAAAEAVNTLIGECLAAADPTRPRDEAYALLALRLEETTYALEPDEGDVILTDGWMELPFLDADELIIAGFREGCVPESTVGHPFLPDALRHRLGLPDNASKEARDRAILRLAVATRRPGAVSVHFHAIDAQGDVLKPSRLLFETDDDTDLLARVRAFYGIRAGTAEAAAQDLPPAWKLKLPVPPAFRPLEKLSPTRLDSYLRCPFTYYLREKSILGDKRLDDRAEELASWEYGNLAHAALEAFGNDPLKDSTDPDAIRAFLEESVDAQLAERFGTAIPAIVSLQGESVKRRLARFAAIQAERRAAGWRIVAAERKLEVSYEHVRFHGKCDRIDYNDATGRWCVIDYKTWDKADKANSFEIKRGQLVWKSLQLPIYCAMLDADNEPPFADARRDRISASYCILGKTKDDVVFTEPITGADVPRAEGEIRRLIRRIERGIFWPPAPTGEWKYDYADWLMPNPAESVDEDWIADQLNRLNAETETPE